MGISRIFAGALLAVLVLDVALVAYQPVTCTEVEGGESGQDASGENAVVSGEEPVLTQEASGEQTDPTSSSEELPDAAAAAAGGTPPDSAEASSADSEHEQLSGESGAETTSTEQQRAEPAAGDSASASGEEAAAAAAAAVASSEEVSGEATTEAAQGGDDQGHLTSSEEQGTSGEAAAAEAESSAPTESASAEGSPETSAESPVEAEASSTESPEEQQPASTAEDQPAAAPSDVSAEEVAASTESAETTEAPSSAEPADSAPAEDPLLPEVAAAAEIEVPDPGPQPGEPAFEYESESESEPESRHDVARDRGVLDDFARTEEGPESAAAADKAVKELKKVVENAIKPLETVYEYNSITSRIFGDSEIHSKPMILVLGPAGTGKTTAIKYLLGVDSSSVPRIPRNSAVAARDMFTVWRWGEEAGLETGTELASDSVFSSMQRYGLATYDRLVGLKVPAPLLKKVTIVDTPAIIESIGHVEEKRTFPVNDVYQWFIDRADLILLVFDPIKPDVGMELEAVLDQLKGREGQTRILVNKADTLSPSDLATAEGDLLWNLSPLLGGNRAPQLYAVSLRQRAYKSSSCPKLLAEQEGALYRDVIDVVNHRIANKIASARRHAIRVRNHSKLINLYLKAYAKAKGLFSNKKKVAKKVVEDPFSHRIYQEISFAKNVSRYDLPDPEIYREFFNEHKLYEFKKFEDLCTYFKGCPQDKLDIAIAYDLAEVLGKYRKDVGSSSAEQTSSEELSSAEDKSANNDMPAVAA